MCIRIRMLVCIDVVVPVPTVATVWWCNKIFATVMVAAVSVIHAVAPIMHRRRW